MGPFFPLFFDLSKKKILFVGAGRIAARRLAVLSPFTSGITVIAPEAEEAVCRMSEDGLLAMDRRPFRNGDTAGYDLVFACTDDPELNRRITAESRDNGTPANNSSDKSDCDFYFPGIVRKDEVVVGITASGASHAGAKAIRERIEEVLGR